MVYARFTIKDIAEMAKARQQNRKDAIICWVGSRGEGKSTGAWKLCHRLKRYEIEHLGEIYKSKRFKPERDMIYSRDDALRFIQNRKFSVMHIDEMINVGYNREFSNTDQQAIIKALNQFRSNFNIISMCNPFFYDLDPDFRSLIWMRIDVIRRGFAIIHTQNDSLFKNDPWDTNYNRKIEEAALKFRKTRPYYSKMSTFRGVLTYGKMSPAEERHYERIRNQKRSAANPLTAGMSGNVSVLSTADKLYSMLVDGKLTKSILLTYCQAEGLSYPKIVNSLNYKLRNNMVGGTVMKLLKSDKEEKVVNPQDTGDSLGYILTQN